MGRIIRRFIQPFFRIPGKAAHPLQVPDGGFWEKGKRQHGGIGRHHMACRFVGYGKRRQAEGPVLIIHIRVKGKIAAFADAEGMAVGGAHLGTKGAFAAVG